MQPVRSKDFERSVAPLSTAVILAPVRPVLSGPLRIRARIKNSPHYLTAATVVKQSGGRIATCREVVDIDLTNRPYFVGNLTRCVPARFGGVIKSSLALSGGSVGRIWRAEDMRDLLASADSLAFSLQIMLLDRRHRRVGGRPWTDGDDEELRLLFQRLLAYRNVDGSFSFLKEDRTPSIWVTVRLHADVGRSLTSIINPYALQEVA